MIVAAVLRLCIYPKERDFENFQEGEQGGGEGRPANSQIQVGREWEGGGGSSGQRLQGRQEQGGLLLLPVHAQLCIPPCISGSQPPPAYLPAACCAPIPPCPPRRCRSCSRA